MVVSLGPGPIRGLPFETAFVSILVFNSKDEVSLISCTLLEVLRCVEIFLRPPIENVDLLSSIVVYRERLDFMESPLILISPNFFPDVFWDGPSSTGDLFLGVIPFPTEQEDSA